MVKVAVPIESANGMLSELNDHFGMAEDFAVFEYDHGEISDLRFMHNDQEKPEPKTNAQFLADEGVKIVLAGFIGPHMLTVLLGEGIRVFKGAAGTLEDVLEDFKADMLTEVHTPGEMLD
ncbi:NifB/NifX family molybdenum-iron cluster-binding protein [Methanocella arvoryzae]|uniref:Dinitrogenase iron-molybdenum cofactor biosynthesis domain-containing protein n=1 Tax=Methanocella arvoryzae (strain DSM 22066 / NBRC 105507 / MRE50) TaxID=351160 RepID=Q0W2A5_METAR|nr:NifB/NifX family molybdenum-iron cluster-binding protein [Methanocella arvoryzae]CAJ37488.1 conserved hypothetical protein [Methanocella arvoryzae MRE50]